MRQYIVRILYLFFIGLVVFLLGCKKAEDYLEQAKEKEDAHNWDEAINLYETMLERFPDYKDRDKVYFELGRLYLEIKENDSLAEDMYKKGIQSCQCDSIIDSLTLAEGFYGLGKVYEKPRTSAVKPLAADSLYKKVVKIGEKAETFKDSALVRMKFLNKRVKVPVGEVRNCEFCGKFLKADKVITTKEKYRHMYRSKYNTHEIRKGRCYKHQYIKIKTGIIKVCPRCGRVISKDVHMTKCMRMDKDKYKVKRVKDSPCIRCQDAEFSLGESMKEILDKLGKPHEERGIKGKSPYWFIWHLSYGMVGLKFSYNHYTNEYTLTQVVPLHTQLSQTGRFEREGGHYFFEFYWRGEKRWANLWSTPEKNLH